ncbi:MAG: tripartite tricarboxylate transporter substrate binding protein [Bradyrhizobiaceae bacterium]|nr:tripartite tricarboxylate transporter substrate binding protein [Bradyrhizobiaceae bacterium]
MRLTRKEFLRAAGAAAALAPFGGIGGAFAQSYPSEDIRIICAFPAGSGADVLVRFFAEKLKPLAKRTVIVENKVGAGGWIAIEHVARSKPDGHTMLLLGANAVAATMSLFKNPSIDVGKTIQVAATINRQPFMVVVPYDSPFKNVAELTAAMKKKGDKATYASAAPAGKIMGEIYKAATGVQAVEVVYKTAVDSLNEILSGKVDYGMHDPVFALAQLREKRLKILGVSTGRRLEANPELPTMKEQGVDMDLTLWWAAMVPQGTPKPVVEQINKWFVEMVSADDTRKFLGGFGGDPNIQTADEAQKNFLRDIKVWADYVKIAKIEPQ